MKARMACGLHIARYVIEELAEGLIMGMKVMEFYDINLDPPSTNKIVMGKTIAPLSFTLFMIALRLI
jgi:hypothetical protein